jgi:signal-transduction protein with cAMP-binding, CBS, and nucleotidyltransferase domain
MSLNDQLRAEKVIHLDLSAYCQVTTGTSVCQAVKEMRASGSRVCLVTGGTRLRGILTERDVLRKVAAHPAVWDEAVETIMTAAPHTVHEDASAAEALLLMDENGVRNLPVLADDGSIVGSVSHQAFIDYLAALYPTDILNLPPRPDQFPEQVEGG